MRSRSLFPFNLIDSAAFLIATLLWLIGCVSAPSINTYVLTAGTAESPTLQASGGVLLVAEPRAEPGFDTALIAYTQSPFTLDYYTKSSWVDTPARMLMPLIINAMERSKIFTAVLSLPTPVEGNLRLETNLIRLQQEFLQKPSQVRLTLRAKLIDTATNQVLGTQLFEVTAVAPSEDAYGGVQAANVAVKRMLEEITDFVLKHVASQDNYKHSANSRDHHFDYVTNITSYTTNFKQWITR
jgi:cholesterol transport system auxiliary component